MGLLGEVQAAQQKAARRCPVATIRDTLDKQDGDDLLAVIADRQYRIRWIISALNGRGFQISEKVISRHRDRGCNCFPQDG